MSKKLFQGIVAVLIANIINMFFNIISNFALPKFLSIDTYSNIKTFQLYSGYVGIFALGYSDGMYIKYGGKELISIGREEMEKNLGTLRNLMLVESIFLILLSRYLHDNVFPFFVFTLFSVNVIGYYKNLFQAIGEFRLYSRVLNISTILKFLGDMLLLFLIRTDDFRLYLLGYVLIDFIILFLLEYYFIFHFKYLNFSNFFFIDLHLLAENIKTGFLLMVGNFSSILLTGMDRWFVKWKMGNVEFAHYSFAVSLEGFLNVAITPVTVTLYNFFCNHDDEKTVATIRRLLFVFSSILISAAFPAKLVIELLLDKYKGSLHALFVLFCAQLFFVPNKAIFINLYKAKAKQAAYFRRLVHILVFGFVANYVIFIIFGTKESFAYATLLSSIFWILGSSYDFKNYSIGIRETCFCAIVIMSFLFCGLVLNAIIGFVVYIVLIGLISLTLFKDEITLARNRIITWYPRRAKLDGK